MSRQALKKTAGMVADMIVELLGVVYLAIGAIAIIGTLTLVVVVVTYGNLVDSGVDITLDEMLGYFIGYGGVISAVWTALSLGAFVLARRYYKQAKQGGNNE
jgi:uncharacterized membrane protein